MFYLFLDQWQIHQLSKPTHDGTWWHSTVFASSLTTKMLDKYPHQTFGFLTSPCWPLTSCLNAKLPAGLNLWTSTEIAVSQWLWGHLKDLYNKISTLALGRHRDEMRAKGKEDVRKQTDVTENRNHTSLRKKTVSQSSIEVSAWFRSHTWQEHLSPGLW